MDFHHKTTIQSIFYPTSGLLYCQKNEKVISCVKITHKMDVSDNGNSMESKNKIDLMKIMEMRDGAILKDLPIAE